MAAKALEASRRAGQAIKQQFELLERAPDIGRPLPDMPELRELVIAFGDSGYVALYRHEPNDDAVYVAVLACLRPRLPYACNLENSMPFLQLDVTGHYSISDKKNLAAKMSQTYSQMMEVDIRRISVAIRELGDGGVWRIPHIGAEPEPVALMMLDIRRGRPAELRMKVAQALCVHCIEILGLRGDRLNVEFTQHDGDEMYSRIGPIRPRQSRVR